MSHQFRVALAGSDEQVVRHKDAKARELTKVANRPSSRQRKLMSAKKQHYELYDGADLKRGSR